MKRHVLITGGAGFIGSHVVRRFVTRYPDYRIVNFDLLTYAGNLANLSDVEQAPNYTFVRGDICDAEAVGEVFRRYAIDGVIHLAAESHVDRSIRDPFTFARTNVLGTLTLLHTAREAWQGAWAGKRFYHISTDEVYGALGFGDKPFNEGTRYDPHSPYSASKASSDHFVRAFHDTYGMPMNITRCSNKYLCLSIISVIVNLYRYMAKAKMCATGSMWRITRGPSTSSSTRDRAARPTTSAAATSGATSTSCG